MDVNFKSFTVFWYNKNTKTLLVCIKGYAKAKKKEKKKWEVYLFIFHQIRDYVHAFAFSRIVAIDSFFANILGGNRP